MDTRITVQALKYGNRLHYEWNTKLLEATDSHIVVLGEYGRELHHHTKGKIFTTENWTIELFPFDLWFTVSADVRNGVLYQYYCNINEPAVLRGTNVSFVDLDLDLVYRNGEWKVVDEDEFAANAVKFGYPEELIRRAREELKNLQHRVNAGLYPFDGTLERFIRFVPAI
ncbi:DUF402 domain-containing protein [Paenibacillus hamazuiensis]|uniref:DUF402 domain-containing protein n=1 Tax=Paenibacillus hamazuiensis TaxID=2936508 RepID=UPI00200C59FD|nr:DUF402 domain-containing protein [Paenibacillus hamazuiensis]